MRCFRGPLSIVSSDTAVAIRQLMRIASPEPSGTRAHAAVAMCVLQTGEVRLGLTVCVLSIAEFLEF